MPGKYLAFIAYSIHFQLPLFPLLFNSILHMIFLSYFANDPAWISRFFIFRLCQINLLRYPITPTPHPEPSSN